MTRVYLDHHTTTRPLRSVIEGFLSFHQEYWGDSTAGHQIGQEVARLLNKDLHALRQEMGVDDEDSFYFCSSGAEAINAVFVSHYLDCVLKTGQNHLVTTNLEEAPVLMSMKRLEELGCIERVIPVNAQGQVTKESLEQAILPQTSLVSLSWANGLTGVIQPISDLVDVCKAHQVRLHVDASYVMGKRYFRFQDLEVDFLTFEGKLIHAPQGTGGVLVKASTIPFHPLIVGSIGENAPGVHALVGALEENRKYLDHMQLEVARLRDLFEKSIVEEIPDAVVFFSEVERLPNCSAIAFPGTMSDALLYILHRRGVYATVGGGRAQKLSHILMASGVDEGLAQCAISFALSFDTTEEEIRSALQILILTVKELKDLSVGVCL